MPFIEAAKGLGYRAVVFDRDPASPGAACADEFYAVSTHDLGAMSGVCDRLNKEGGLKGIITYSSDSKPLLAVAKLCQRAGLPSYSPESVSLAIDKGKMKQKFREAGVLTPVSVVTDTPEGAAGFLSRCSLPVIVKPSSGAQGSLGVSIVREAGAIGSAFASASGISDNGFVVIEEFSEGREFSVDGVVSAGQPLVLAISEKFNLGFENNFTISGFATGPDAGEGEREDLSSISAAALVAVRAMYLDNTFFSVDLISTDNGPMVIECGVLLDAKMDRLLNFAGVDVYEMICRVATGAKVSFEGPLPGGKAYALKFMFAGREGALRVAGHSVPGEFKDGDRRIAIEWEGVDGDSIRPPRSVADTVGWVITEGDNRKEAYGFATGLAEGSLFQVV